MINIGDLKWTVGFLEGEGYFCSHRNYPSIQVQQVQKWPIEKLKSLFSGKIYLIQSKNEKWRKHWRWELGSRNSIALMMTIYGLMSPNRKEQIKKCIIGWKKQKKDNYRDKPYCPHGHKWTKENTYIYQKTGQRECRACHRTKNRNRNQLKLF